MQKSKKLIRFDWAIKRILRDKANFEVLEGFLTTLLKEKVTIKSILGSQANKEADDDKYNDVDILVENSKGELVIIEVQNTKEHDYFHRILYGSSKIITQYINEGNPYAEVKKVISITIAYFDLGQGLDYVYHGSTSFKGYHHGDEYDLSFKQRELYKMVSAHQIYPEYWIIKAGIFDEGQVNDRLDEWIYFFKMGEVQENFTAAGLKEAKRVLDRINLPDDEREAYEAYLERLRRIASRETNEMEDIKYAIKKAEEKSAAKIAKAQKAVAKAEKEKDKAEKALLQHLKISIKAMHRHGLAIPIIAKSLGLSEQSVSETIESTEGQE